MRSLVIWPRLPTDGRLSPERAGVEAENGMAPVPGDLGQGPHDETPQVRPGMGQGQPRLLENAPSECDEVEVERSRGVGPIPDPTKLRFDRQKSLEGLARAERRLDKGDGVEIIRVGRVGPCRRAPKARKPDDPETGLRHSRDGGRQEIAASFEISGLVRAQGDDAQIVDRHHDLLQIQGTRVTFYPTDRLALFIDGSNLHGAAKALGFDIDFKRLLDEFRKRGLLVRAYYYTTLMEDQEYSPIRPLVDWLDYNGFTLVTKPGREYVDREGRKRWRGDMHVELTVDMMELAARVDHIVLFSGESDFAAAVAAVQRRGVRVTVVSTMKSQPPLAGDELRRQADAFVDLADLSEIIGRAPRDRFPRFLQESPAATA